MTHCTELTKVTALGNLCCCNTRRAILKRQYGPDITGQRTEEQVVTIKFQHRNPGNGEFYDDNFFRMNKMELTTFINKLKVLRNNM